MDKEKLVGQVFGAFVAGFFIGVGFWASQRVFNKKAKKDSSVSDQIKDGVKEGVKQAKMEEDAAQFAAMNSKGGQAKRMMAGRGRFMGFDGDASKMKFSADPRLFGMSPNGDLNNF